MSDATLAACGCLFGGGLIVFGIALAHRDERMATINILVGCALMWIAVITLARL